MKWVSEEMVVQNIERDILMNVKAGSEVERKEQSMFKSWSLHWTHII